MRTALATLAFLTGLGLSSLGFAADMQGTVMEVQAETASLTLTDGTIIVAEDPALLDGIEPGTVVQITYETNANGDHVASAIAPAS